MAVFTKGPSPNNRFSHRAQKSHLRPQPLANWITYSGSGPNPIAPAPPGTASRQALY